MASDAVTRDFPTPPLPLTIPMTLPTRLSSCKGAEKSVFSFLSVQDSEQLPQLWLQFSLIYFPSCSMNFLHIDTPEAGDMQACSMFYIEISPPPDR